MRLRIVMCLTLLVAAGCKDASDGSVGARDDRNAQADASTDAANDSSADGGAIDGGADLDMRALDAGADADADPIDIGPPPDNDMDPAAVCGDGELQGDEICDGDCPDVCDSSDACSIATLTGSSATCDAVCEFTLITACQDADGCCPAGCDDTNDSDCAAVCGDGLVEGAELCDGNCPGSCTAPNACTTSALVGAAATCDAMCADMPIVSCIDGDNCCPAGCTEVDDTDCSAVCGNGVVEPSETCDGNCPAICTAPNACTTSTLTGAGATCDAACVETPITSCTDGDGCCPTSCTNANDDDCPPACTPGNFASLLTTSAISNSSHSGPVFAAPLSDGTALVAFHGGGTIHVVQVTATGTRTGTEYTTTGTRLYGLAAHDNGRAVLVSRGSDELALVAWDAAGNQDFDITILGNVPHDVVGNEWFGALLRQGRITWTGNAWATYNTVQRLWSDMIAHYGDTLRYYDADGNQLGGGWGWGCSHSMEVRISHNGSRTGPVCLSDCFPQKGVHFSHNQEQLYTDPAANCGGVYTTELGASVPVAGGFWVLFAANDNRQSQDVALAMVNNSGNQVGSLIWFTDDNAADADPNAALYGTELLVAWEAGGTDTYVRADASTGAMLGTPMTLSGGDLGTASDFFTFPNGNAGWAFSAGGDVHLAVMDACP